MICCWKVKKKRSRPLASRWQQWRHKKFRFVQRPAENCVQCIVAFAHKIERRNRRAHAGSRRPDGPMQKNVANAMAAKCSAHKKKRRSSDNNNFQCCTLNNVQWRRFHIFNKVHKHLLLLRKYMIRQWSQERRVRWNALFVTEVLLSFISLWFG